MSAAGGSDGRDSVRLRLQALPVPSRALALGALAGARSGDGVFSTKQVADLMTDLRLPPVGNLSATLGRLRGQNLVMQPAAGTWALTPLGEREANAQGVAVPGAAVQAAGQPSGSEFGERHHDLIPPLLGPMGAAPGLNRVLDESPFEQNVMLITRFPKDEEDHFAKLIPQLRGAVAAHGLRLLVASDGMKEDTLWANVVTYMWASKYAIVLLDKPGEALNSNVLIEIGGMLMTGRRCAILRDQSVPAMPSDLVGHIYKGADLADHDASVAEIHKWIRDDLSLGACPSCPPAEAD